MGCYNAPQGRWDTYRSKLGEIVGVLVETEEVCIGEELLNWLWDKVIVNQIKEGAQITIDFLHVHRCQIDEEVERVTGCSRCFLIGSS